jgi:hypothetical protein
MEAQKKVVVEEKTDNVIPRKKSVNWLWIILGIVIVLIVMWWVGALPVGNASNSAYQAVFLANDQVYFGKLSNANSQYPVLRDVYYLQVTQTLQPGQQANPGTNINLVKLGNELHGPEDAMIINRDQILFYENLKLDSQVVNAIKQSKEEKK